MRVEGVHEVARLVATRECQHLVDGEVDFVEGYAAPLVWHRGHEAPSRVELPIRSPGLANSNHGPGGLDFRGMHQPPDRLNDHT